MQRMVTRLKRILTVRFNCQFPGGHRKRDRAGGTKYEWEKRGRRLE
jgi:hypothetical protein